MARRASSAEPPRSLFAQRWRLGLAIGGGILLIAGAVVAGWQFSSRTRPPEESIDVLLRRAKAAIERSKSAEAKLLLDRLLRRDPDHGLALLYRGQLARDRGDAAAALADWQRVEERPANIAGTARYLEATLWLDRGDARRAEELLRESIRLHPNYPQPHARLVELYVVQGRRNDVRREITRLVGSRALMLDDLVFRIVPPLRATTPDSGASLMQFYLEANPKDPYSRLALAEYLLEGEKPREAIAALEQRSAGMPPVRLAALSAQARLKIGELETARSTLSEFPASQKSRTDLLRAHAALAEAEENWSKAARFREWIVDAEPEDATSLYHLGRALQHMGEASEGRETLARASQLDLLQTTALRLIWGRDDQPALTVPIFQKVSRLLFELDYPVESARWLRRLAAMQPRDQMTRAALNETMARIRARGESAARDDPFGPNEDTAEFVARTDSEVSREVGAAEAGQTDSSAGQSREVDARGRIVLRDRHAEAGLDYTYFNGKTSFKHLVESMGGGVGVLDFDADGTPDLYFPQGSGIPPDESDHSHLDRLYQNRGDGTFRNVAEQSGIVEPRYGQGIASADFDNDGFDDIVVGNYGRNSCFRNNGDGTFSRVERDNGLGARGEMTSSLGFGDLNRDGVLDLYVANYVTQLKTCRGDDGTYHSCSPTNFDARQDRLFQGDGEGRFADITQSSGIVVPDGKGLGVLIADLDADEKPDVYVANDTTPNFLFRNESSEKEIRFVEEGLTAGVALSGDGRAQAGMGIACADFDGNGRLDLHTTNFYEETNALYLNQGRGFFRDATRQSRLANPSFNVLGFGTQAADFNMDGWPDVFVANGHIDDFSDRGEPWKMAPQVFLNRGEARFVEQSEKAGPYFEGKYLGRGVARLDYDGDGRPDLAVVHQDRPLGLLHNESPEAGHRIAIELRGTKSNRSAIGARVVVKAGRRTQTLAVCGGDGFCSTNARRQFVGLGETETVESLTIHWPSGLVEEWNDLPAGTRILCREGRDPLIDPL